MDTDRFARARILIEHSRHDLAAAELAARIGEDPENPEGYILLSYCRNAAGDRAGASDAARRAVELAPDEARAHFVVCLAEFRRGDLDEAEAAVRRAIELSGGAAGYFGQLAAIELARYHWAEALRAADQGLALDPDDDVCLNNRAVALTKLGRHAEAASTLEGTLEKHPEDAFTHANRGTSLLHENEPRRAIEHFREALRLDPNSGWAKAGLLEALRAKNWFYRRVLQFFLRLSRFPPRVQFGLIIGMLVVVQILGSLGKQFPAGEPVFLALILAYVGFVAATWFASHILNVLLLFDRDGRVLLDGPQKWLSVICTTLVVGVLVLAACAVFGSDRRSAPAAVFVFLFAVHLASVFQIPAGRFRWMGIGLSALVLGLFAYERLERFELFAELDRIQRRADEHDAKLADLRASPPSAETEAAARSLGVMRAELTRALERFRASAEKLNSWESILGFASLGGLLVHTFLAVKAKRAEVV